MPLPINRTLLRSPRARRAVAVVASTAACATALLAPAGQPADAATSATYVNLGDSYSAGSGVLPLASDAPADCNQSAKNWAHDIAAAKGYSLKDVSCGGAATDDFYASQFSDTPPQLDALSAATQLVTLTVGGNDNDIFATVIGDCASAAFATGGWGNPCEVLYGDSFVNTINNEIYPKIVKALKDVKAHAPNARILMSDYIWILPPTKGCYPTMPIATGDVPYVYNIQKVLDDAMKNAAAVACTEFVEQRANSVGHDGCKSSSVRWVEPAFGSSQYVPVHPNAAGEQAMANQVLAYLG